MNNQEEKRSSRKFFIFYCIVLFLFAAILITISYLSQARVENEAEKIRQELTTKTEMAEGFASRLEQANAKNAEFETTIMEQKKQIDELTKQTADLTAAQETQIKKTTAAEYLWKLVKARLNKNYRECRTIIAAIDTEGLRSYLSEEGLRELERIEKITKGA